MNNCTLDYARHRKARTSSGPMLVAVLSVLAGCWMAPVARNWTMPDALIMRLPPQERLVAATCLVVGGPTIGVLLGIAAMLFLRGRADRASSYIGLLAMTGVVISGMVLVCNGLGVILISGWDGPG